MFVVRADFVDMMMIAFITIKSSLVPLIEGLCAQIYFRFENYNFNCFYYWKQ